MVAATSLIESPGESAEAELRRLLFRELLCELPDDQAEALALRVVLGWTLPTIARALGAPVKETRQRIRLAKVALGERRLVRDAGRGRGSRLTNGIDIHPEDLLDKEARLELSAVERARLEAHRAHCEPCVLETALRCDIGRDNLVYVLRAPPSHEGANSRSTTPATRSVRGARSAWRWLSHLFQPF